MKRFDVLKWIRGVREAQHEREKNLTTEQKLAQTRAAARAFRKSRQAEKVTGTKRKGRSS